MEHLKVKVLVKDVAGAMRHLSESLGRVAVIAGAGLVIDAGARAQEAPPEPPTSSASVTAPAPAQAQAGFPTTQTVVVSARKKLERDQDVPMAISAVSAESLIDKNRVGIQDFFAEIPGLNLAAGERGSSEISIRGVTSGVAANPTSAITIDDAPFGSSTSNGGGGGNMPDIDPADLQRIEVLRGPQGTLYGASSLGGLVKYVTAVPNTSKFSGRVQVDGSRAAGGNEGYGLRASLNIPLSEGVAGLRASVYDRRDPGFVDDTRQHRTDVDATRTRGGRISALVTPTDTLSIRASAMFQQSRADGSAIEDVDANGKPLFGVNAHQRIPGTDGFNRNYSFFDLAVTNDFDWAKLTSTTAYGRIDYTSPQDGTNTLRELLDAIGAAGLGVTVQNGIRSTKFSQELRLDSPEGKRTLDWRVGLFYTKEKGAIMQELRAADLLTGTTAAAVPLIALADTSSDFEEVAAFGTATYHFTDRFDVQAGGRVSHNKQTYREDTDGILTGGANHIDSGSSARAATYLITPRFIVSPDLMTYATVATGYRPGGPNSGVSQVAPPTYGSDRTTNFELGVKGDVMNRTLSYNVALYRINWKDIQLLGIDPLGLTYFGNGSAAKSEGIETSFTWAASSSLRISGNVVVGRAELTKDVPTDSANEGHAGDRLPFSSKLTSSLSATRTFPVAAGLQGFVSGTVSYVGDRLGTFQPAGRERLYFAGYATADLQAGVKAKTWTAGVFAKNLADKRAYLGGITRGAVSQYTVMAPRTVGFTLSRSM